jgi:phytol kinase
MLAVILCLTTLVALVLIAEILWEQRKLKGEYLRKLIHISGGTFIAFWPWFMSWGAIQVLGVLALLGFLINRELKLFNFLGRLKRISSGEIFFSLAIIICATLTTSKVFFAVSILMVALADGLAAVMGTAYGLHRWKYTIYGHTKTLIGSMTFWIVAILILGAGLLFAHDSISFNNYILIIFALPPVLTTVENFSVYGLDNLVLPVVTLVILQVVQI